MNKDDCDCLFNSITLRQDKRNGIATDKLHCTEEKLRCTKL